MTHLLKHKGMLYAITANFFALGFFIFSKLSFSYFNVLTVASLWFGFSAIFSFSVIIIRKKDRKLYIPTFKKQWKPILVAMLLNVGSVLTSFYAIYLMGAGLSGFLLKFHTVTIIFFGVVLLNEKFNLFEILSGIITISGVVLISFSKGEFVTLGIAIVILNSICIGLARYIVKSRLGNIKPLLLVNYRATIVFVCVFAIAIFSGQFKPYLTIGLLYATIPSVFSVILFHLFTYRAYQLMEMSKVQLINSLEPLIVIIGSYIILQERLSIIEFLGGITIVIGVVALALSRKNNYKKNQPV